MKNKYRVAIVDGTNLFIRYFSADTKSIDSFGMPCGGVAGSLKGIRHVLRDLNPHEVIVVFDGKDNSKRKQKIDEQYKQGKQYSFVDLLPQENKSLFDKQMAKLLLILKNLPMKVFAVEQVEADDVIGYLVYLLNKIDDESIEKVIVGVDNDFHQLLNETTTMYNTRSKDFFTHQDFKNKNDFNATNFHIFKTFAGEGKQRDNIPRILTKRKIMGYFDRLLHQNTVVSITELEDFIKSNDIPVDMDRVRKNFNLVNLHVPNISNNSKIEISKQLKNYEQKRYSQFAVMGQALRFGLDRHIYSDFYDYMNLYKLRNNEFSKYILSEVG